MPGPEIVAMTERWTRLVMETTASDVIGGIWYFCAMHHVLLITLAVVICGPICCAVYIADPGEADEYLSEKSRRQYRAKRRREMQETVAQLVAQDNVKAKEH